MGQAVGHQLGKEPLLGLQRVEEDGVPLQEAVGVDGEAQQALHERGVPAQGAQGAQPQRQQGRAPGEARRRHGVVVVPVQRIAQALGREARLGGEPGLVLAGLAPLSRRAGGLYRVDTCCR